MTGKEKEIFLHIFIFVDIYRSSRLFLEHPVVRKIVNKFATIIKVFSPTDAQLDSLKSNFKFSLKLTLKISYMFRCKTPPSGSTLSELC
jgi:hypothetical protein